MKPITELSRRATPFPKPQALFVDDSTLWMSSRATQRVYAVDRGSLRVTWETAAPSVVWGLTKWGADLFAVLGEEAEGTPRTIRRCMPRVGFDPAFSVPCPEGLGSHLSFDGVSLILSQWYPQKLISIGRDGQPGRVLPVPHQIVGHCFAQGAFWLATTDDEETNDYWLTRLDPATGRSQDVARIGFAARALSFDGQHFWTNHREANEVVQFAFAD
ncbi:MAG: hypothetical protein C0518_05655 [Opitutus sp.]|nr:hypothetical protein [Opitutus sp.]